MRDRDGDTAPADDGNQQVRRKIRKNPVRSSSQTIPSTARMIKGAGKNLSGRGGRAGEPREGGWVPGLARSRHGAVSRVGEIPFRLQLPSCLIVLDVFSVPQERHPDLAAPDV